MSSLLASRQVSARVTWLTCARTRISTRTLENANGLHLGADNQAREWGKCRHEAVLHRPTQRILTDYRGPGFFAVLCFGSYPLSHQQVVSLSQSSCVSPVDLRVGGGAESNNGEKAWSFINHSILSGRTWICNSHACTNSWWNIAVFSISNQSNINSPLHVLIKLTINEIFVIILFSINLYFSCKVGS